MKRSVLSLLVPAACVILSAATQPVIAIGPGILDNSFSGDGMRTVDYSGRADTLYGVATNGNSPAACGVSDSQALVAKFMPGGALDTSFSGDGLWRSNILGNGSSYLEACRFLPDGRLIAVGWAEANDGTDRMIVVILKPNGMLDTSFAGDGVAAIAFPGNPNAYGYDLAIQPDGKIVAVGETYDSSVIPPTGFFIVARLKPNGALDDTFSGDGRAKVDFHEGDEGIWKVIVQDDGRIVVAGWVRDAGDTEWNTGIARFRPNGSLDPTFSGDGKSERNFLAGYDDYAYGLDVRDDGRIVLGVYRYDDDHRSRIAQLEPGGQMDSSFGGDGIVASFGNGLSLEYIMLDGAKILVGGRDEGTSTPAIVRLRSGGSLDPTFVIEGFADLAGVSAFFNDFTFDAQGRIVAGGFVSDDGVIFRVLG
jgi:uncharacterized delta-60 repeat protein